MPRALGQITKKVSSVGDFPPLETTSGRPLVSAFALFGFHDFGPWVYSPPRMATRNFLSGLDLLADLHPI